MFRVAISIILHPEASAQQKILESEIKTRTIQLDSRLNRSGVGPERQSGLAASPLLAKSRKSWSVKFSQPESISTLDLSLNLKQFWVASTAIRYIEQLYRIEMMVTLAVLLRMRISPPIFSTSRRPPFWRSAGACAGCRPSPLCRNLR